MVFVAGASDVDDAAAPVPAGAVETLLSTDVVEAAPVPTGVVLAGFAVSAGAMVF